MVEFINKTSSPKFKKEHIWVIAFALVAMFITSIPYLVGYAVQGDEWQFSGFVFGVEDGNTYLAKMLRGAQGDWLFRTPFTTFKQDGIFTFFPYLLLGKLSGGENQHDQLVVLFHFFRIVGGILAVFAAYDLSSIFLKKENNRRFAVILITLGGGMGWLLILVGQKDWLGSLPLDFYSPETFGFLGLYGIPHLPWARAFLLWGLRGYLISNDLELKHLQPVCKIANWNPGILWLLTGIFQPITGMLTGVITGFHILGLIGWNILKDRSTNWGNWDSVLFRLKNAVKFGFVALPLVIYNLIIFGLDPFVRNWMEQTQNPPPHFAHYLVAYGLILPFAFMGLFVLIKNPSNYGIFLISWAISLPILLTFPFSQNRRFIEGFWVALVILAMIARENSQRKVFQKTYLILGFSFFSTLVLIIGGLNIATRHGEPVFRPRDEVMVFNYLLKHAEDRDVVLSSYETGNALPAWAPVYVIIGHRPESVGIKEATPLVEAFFQETSLDEDRIIILEKFGVDFVFWGPTERSYGGWDPSTAPYLDAVFVKGDYQIFQVSEFE